jgi:outer membrane protein assembly factor BamB
MSAQDDPGNTKRRSSWERWWAQEGPRLDLSHLSMLPGYIGLTLVPEMHANKVWECGKDGKPLWEITGLSCPIDAQALPGNRLLVAELNGNAVTERDRSGKILWRHHIGTPIACERLSNGQTFIATNSRLLVVSRDGKETTTYNAENGFFIHSVQRLSNGHIACVSMEGTVREIDAAGKVLCSVPLPISGGWSGVEGVSGNRYLVVNNNQGKVMEVDRTGKALWEFHAPGACYASRLPNGNTLVVSNRSGLLEVDRAGKTLWSRSITTALWRAHRR